MPSVRLRALEPEDLPILYDVENDRTLWDVGVTNVPYSRFLLSQFIANTTGDIYADKQLRLMADDEHGHVVGMADLIDYSPCHGRAELGIVVCKPYRGQGYGGAILRELISYARTTLHLHQLYAVIGHANNAAIHLLQQEGFSHTATLADWLFDGRRHHDALLLQLVLKK